jgi:hypothetical protein
VCRQLPVRGAAFGAEVFGDEVAAETEPLDEPEDAAAGLPEVAAAAIPAPAPNPATATAPPITSLPILPADLPLDIADLPVPLS